MSDGLPEGGCWDAEFRKSQGDVRTVIVVAAVLVDIDGRVLVAQRPAGKAMAGLWEFPGGKLEAGELPETALVRELKAPLTFASHLYEDFHLLMPVYVARQWKGEPQGLDGQALKWVQPVKLRDLAMPPADEPLIALIRDFLG